MTEAFDFTGYEPGTLGRIAELHGALYAQSHGFGLYFEAKVARELADFLQGFDPARDFFRVVRSGSCVLGSIAVARPTDGNAARLRWFVLAPEARGRGFGRRLLDDAIAFCRRTGYARVYLWTLTGQEPAGRLYREAGFVLAEEALGEQWGQPVLEQRLELSLKRL